MYIFLFWPFRVFGFIISLFALAKLGQTFFPNLLSSTLGSILAVFAIPLVALFWIDFHKLYFKLLEKQSGLEISWLGYSTGKMTTDYENIAFERDKEIIDKNHIENSEN